MNLDIEGIALYVYPVLIALIVVEYFTARHLYNLKESLSSFVIAGVSTIIVTSTKVVALGVFFIVFEV